MRYTVYNKELLAIIKAFYQWKLYLSSTKQLVKIHLDYKNL